MGEKKHLFFQRTDNDYDEFISNVNYVNNMWEHTSKSGYYYCTTPCSIYPANKPLPKMLK